MVIAIKAHILLRNAREGWKKEKAHYVEKTKHVKMQLLSKPITISNKKEVLANSLKFYLNVNSGKNTSNSKEQGRDCAIKGTLVLSAGRT